MSPSGSLGSSMWSAAASFSTTDGEAGGQRVAQGTVVECCCAPSSEAASEACGGGVPRRRA